MGVYSDFGAMKPSDDMALAKLVAAIAIGWAVAILAAKSGAVVIEWLI